MNPGKTTMKAPRFPLISGFRSTVLFLILAALMLPIAYVSAQDTEQVFMAVAVNEFPHDVEAYTQGLVIHNGFLFEGTGLNGYSSIRREHLETGVVLQQRDMEKKYFGEGITIFDDMLIQVTYLNREGFVYTVDEFEPVSSFRYTQQGWGLTHDGEKLIMSDGTSTLYFLDPVSFSKRGQIDVWSSNGPLTHLNELEYIDGEIWANVYPTYYIARINPETGQVNSWINCSELLDDADWHDKIDVLNGIAYDPETGRIFVTGKRWPKLYEIELIPMD